LKRVVDGIESERPLFFLLDEILQGTNSRERVIGARSVLRHLLERGAMGAVSTHDVGLLDLPPELDAKLDKVHFEEQARRTKPRRCPRLPARRASAIDNALDHEDGRHRGRSRVAVSVRVL
jgi:hypothetical protein